MTKNQKITVFILTLGAFVSVLNQTLLNPAIPVIMKEFHISATTAQWLISGFMLVNALVIAISPFLMERFSTRKLFISMFALLAAGSLVAAWSVNFPMLLLGRILQAICAGVMLPMSMTILLLIYPHEKRGTAMGMYTFVIMFAPAIGPVVSGVMTDRLGWHWMFLVIAALAALVVALALFCMKNFGEVKKVRLDKPSVALSSLGLASLLYGFSELGNAPVIAGIVIALGVFVLVFFCKRQLRMERPFLHIRVFADKQFRTGTTLIMLITISLMAVSLLLPLYIQTVRGLSATLTGTVMFPGAVLGAIAGYFSGYLHDKFGSRHLVIAGVSLLITGSVGMALFDLSTSVMVMILVYGVRQVGLMLANTPITMWSIQNLPDEILAHGNAVSSTLRQVAATLGTAIMVSVMAGFELLIGSKLAGMGVAYWLCTGIAALCLILAICKIKDTKRLEPTAEYELDKAMRVPPYKISSGETLAQAIGKLIEYKTSGMPVVDHEDRIVGFISDEDLIRYLSRQDIQFVTDSYLSLMPDRESFGDKANELLGENIMTVAQKKPLVVDRSVALSEVCRLFSEHRLSKLSVTQNGVLVGTISRGDIMRFLMGRLPLSED